MNEGQIDYSQVKSKCPMVGSQVSYDIDLKILKVEISINLRCTIYVHSFKIDIKKSMENE